MSRIISDSLPDIPWMEKPEGYSMPIWRYKDNPIIDRNAIKSSNSIFIGLRQRLLLRMNLTVRLFGFI